MAELNVIPDPASRRIQAQLSLGGLHGHPVSIHIVPTYPDGDPRNTPKPPGTLRTYRVVVVLSRPGVLLRPEDQLGVADLLEGDSHIRLHAADEPAGPDTVSMLAIETFGEPHPLTLTARPNGRGLLAKLETQINAVSHEAALQQVVREVGSVLSLWSIHLDVPIQIFQVDCIEVDTGHIMTSAVRPFPDCQYSMFRRGVTTAEFRQYASLYREGLNSNSPPYQFLCLYKILEAVSLRRQHVKLSPWRLNREAVRDSERVPAAADEFVPWLNRLYLARPKWEPDDFAVLFPIRVRGWRFGRIMTEHLEPLRKAVAHALTEAGEIRLFPDDLFHIRFVQIWLPLTRVMVRRVLKDEFPDQFLVHLGEDGQVIQRPTLSPFPGTEPGDTVDPHGSKGK